MMRTTGLPTEKNTIQHQAMLIFRNMAKHGSRDKNPAAKDKGSKNYSLCPEGCQEQASIRFKNPMPPKPELTKLAVGLCGATQQRKASDPRNGNTNSGSNCHRIMPTSTPKNTLISLRDNRLGFSRCFFCVSKRADWQRLGIR